ncbi:hypothetical protein WOLCODRAFT_166930 [Wolfiporia cocos MD-104 SS10]|uniref:Uncharacterized protein n=1 Tax=Wolfiporia cocos (strain MD-104) TaxID=742152 RepID=A0A2H3JKB9_WOLCO|nr:hypothetical protein WOLCODRAFT_166930 [Wolfiporia cocos MD-104 SS10]
MLSSRLVRRPSTVQYRIASASHRIASPPPPPAVRSPCFHRSLSILRASFTVHSSLHRSPPIVLCAFRFHATSADGSMLSGPRRTH